MVVPVETTQTSGNKMGNTNNCCACFWDNHIPKNPSVVQQRDAMGRCDRALSKCSSTKNKSCKLPVETTHHKSGRERFELPTCNERLQCSDQGYLQSWSGI